MTFEGRDKLLPGDDVEPAESLGPLGALGQGDATTAQLLGLEPAHSTWCTIGRSCPPLGPISSAAVGQGDHRPRTVKNCPRLLGYAASKFQGRSRRSGPAGWRPRRTGAKPGVAQITSGRRPRPAAGAGPPWRCRRSVGLWRPSLTRLRTRRGVPRRQMCGRRHALGPAHRVRPADGDAPTRPRARSPALSKDECPASAISAPARNPRRLGVHLEFRSDRRLSSRVDERSAM